MTGTEGLLSSGRVTNVSGRACDKCDWLEYSVQDEEHSLLDYPQEHLVCLRTQHRQLVFPTQYKNSPTR